MQLGGPEAAAHLQQQQQAQQQHQHPQQQQHQQPMPQEQQPPVLPTVPPAQQAPPVKAPEEPQKTLQQPQQEQPKIEVQQPQQQPQVNLEQQPKLESTPPPKDDLPAVSMGSGDLPSPVTEPPIASPEIPKIQNDQLEVTTTNPSTINEPVKPIENLETLKNVDPVLDNQSTDERKEVLTEVNEIIKEEDPVQEPLKDEPIDVPERPQNDEVKTGESSDLPPSDPNIPTQNPIIQNPAAAEIPSNDFKSAVEHVLATSAASITSVAGAHATQVNASPEDMEFNRLKSTYVNTQGEFVLENVASMASEVILSSVAAATASPTLVEMVSPTSAIFTSASAQELDFEIIDGTKIYNDGRVEIVSKTSEEILPTRTIETEPQLMTEQPLVVSNADQPPDIQSSVVEINANVESNKDSINVEPTEELNPQVFKSEAPVEHISTSQVHIKEEKEDEEIIASNKISEIVNIESTDPPKESEPQTVPPVMPIDNNEIKENPQQEIPIETVIDEKIEKKTDTEDVENQSKEFIGGDIENDDYEDYDDEEEQDENEDIEINKAFVQEQLQVENSPSLNSEENLFDNSEITNEFLVTEAPLEVDVTSQNNEIEVEPVKEEESQGFFGNIFGSSEQEEPLNEEKIDEIPQEQPIIHDQNNEISQEQPVPETQLSNDDFQINSHEEIKFYEPGDAPEYVSTENPVNENVIDEFGKNKNKSLKTNFRPIGWNSLECGLEPSSFLLNF